LLTLFLGAVVQLIDHCTLKVNITVKKWDVPFPNRKCVTKLSASGALRQLIEWNSLKIPKPIQINNTCAFWQAHGDIITFCYCILMNMLTLHFCHIIS